MSDECRVAADMIAGIGASPAWPYPTIAKGSKLGVHTLASAHVTQMTQTLVNAGTRFPIVKAVDDVSMLADAKRLSPGTITMARLHSEYEGCGNVEKPSSNLDTMADTLIKLITDKIAASPELQGGAVDYWEVVNEPDPPGAEGYRRLALLMIECMERAEQKGLKLAIFTLNAGTPEWDEMQAMVSTGVFARARQGKHIMATHEGVFSPNDPIDKWWGDSIPGAPPVEGAGALCFRYRYLYSLLQQRNEVIPLVVSEWCGYDQRSLSPDQVAARVRWYDDQARKDYWVWAFCPFTLGPSAQWVSHDYGPSYPRLLEDMISIKDQANGLAQQPNQYGAPREQYPRVYVLLPPDSTGEWAKAVLEATWESRRFTVGGSADDAGIGDLDSRTVVAVNPSHWPSSLEQFFKTYYTGVRYVPVEAATPQQLAAQLRALNL